MKTQRFAGRNPLLLVNEPVSFNYDTKNEDLFNNCIFNPYNSFIWTG